MNIQNDRIDIDPEALRDLYNQQYIGVKFTYAAEAFQDKLQEYLTPYAEFLFEILPKCTRLHKNFFNHLESNDEIQIHKLANMCGIISPSPIRMYTP